VYDLSCHIPHRKKIAGVETLHAAHTDTPYEKQDLISLSLELGYD